MYLFKLFNLCQGFFGSGANLDEAKEECLMRHLLCRRDCVPESGRGRVFETALVQIISVGQDEVLEKD
jgi:hypothetical protein